MAKQRIRCSYFVLIIEGQRTERIDKTKDPAPLPPLLAADTATSYPAIHLDWEDWVSELEDQDAHNEHKRAITEALIYLVVGFVKLGWDADTPSANCGQDADLIPALLAAMVESSSERNEEDV